MLDFHTELLGVEWMENRRVMRRIDRTRKMMDISIGWHYPIDISWILATLDRIGLPRGATVLDAGAGMGVLQFLLAELGYRVLSIDISSRTPSRVMRIAHRVRTVETGQTFDTEYLQLLARNNQFLASTRRSPSRIAKGARLVRYAPRALWRRFTSRGEISMYEADLAHLDFLASGTVDAVVSVSAIEHIETDGRARAIAECRRVLKPGGWLVCTTSAAADGDWFHEPSKGWCFSRPTLEVEFSGVRAKDHWDRYESVLEGLRGSRELQARLPASYRLSDANGMPRGRWDPAYVPVGVCARV